MNCWARRIAWTASVPMVLLFSLLLTMVIVVFAGLQTLFVGLRWLSGGGGDD